MKQQSATYIIQTHTLASTDFGYEENGKVKKKNWKKKTKDITVTLAHWTAMVYGGHIDTCTLTHYCTHAKAM